MSSHSHPHRLSRNSSGVDFSPRSFGILSIIEYYYVMCVQITNINVYQLFHIQGTHCVLPFYSSLMCLVKNHKNKNRHYIGKLFEMKKCH